MPQPWPTVSAVQTMVVGCCGRAAAVVNVPVIGALASRRSFALSNLAR